MAPEMKKSKAKLPEVVLIWIYQDEREPVVFLDEGQDFRRLIRQFNKQDADMVHEEDLEGPAHDKWMGFEEFMEAHGCRMLKAKDMCL